MTEILVICRGCLGHGSVQRVYGDKEKEHMSFRNGYLCWRNGKREWWEITTEAVMGLCPKCQKKYKSEPNTLRWWDEEYFRVRKNYGIRKKPKVKP